MKEANPSGFAISLRLAGALLAIMSVAAGASERNGFDLRDASVPLEQIEQGGPPRDGIPSIDNPKFLSASEARFLDRQARVLGVFHNGVAKAYPIAILNWHEIVNDRFGLDPIVVTFCPLCGTGMAFSSTVSGRALRFGVSGLLYNSDVLLYDRQTASLWSQIASRAISGKMNGQSLTPIPIANTSWDDWRRRHPGTLVLSPATGHSRDYGRDPYDGYARDEKLFFAVRFTSQRYHPKEVVIGVRVGDEVKAYPFVEMVKTSGTIPDRLGTKHIRIQFDASARTARVFDEHGREIPSVTAFWFAWYAFHPQTQVFTPVASH